MMMKKIVLICTLMLCVFISACVTNPVTGKQEMGLVSTDEEIKMGKENYAPLQQSEGGSYDIDAGLTTYVQQIGNKLAAVSDRKLPYEFVVINSSVPNAWALPGGKIGVNRGLLLELNSEAELAAVIGHEIVHAAARHSAKKMETGMALNIGLVLLGVSQRDNDYGKVMMAGGMVGAALLGQKYSRDAESEADRFGIEYMVRAGYDPDAAVKLQETFVRLSENQKSDWMSGLFASHPPSIERVRANRELAKKYKRPGLVVGEQTYKRKIAGLVKNKQAYADYEAAGKAMNEKKYAQADALIDKAIKQESREALFYATKGDIQAVQKQYKNSISHYDKAIQLNPNLFYFYLRRGLSYKELNNKSKAKQDLDKSMQLLPTQQAQQALKELK